MYDFLFEMQYLYTNMTKLQFIYVYVCIHIYRYIYMYPQPSQIQIPRIFLVEMQQLYARLHLTTKF